MAAEINGNVPRFVDLYAKCGMTPSDTSEGDDDIVQGDNDDTLDDDESFGLLACLFRAFAVNDRMPPIPTVPPPLPTSEIYLADLLRYELSRAKRNRFCYLRCLDPVDQELFQAKMVEVIEASGKERDLQELFITQGCMRMGTWRRIMQQTRTMATYKLWRAAYWGENARRPPTSSNTTNYRVLVETFVGQLEAKEVHLVHYDGHLQRVPAVCISPALWSNDQVSQQLWAEISY